MGWGQSRHESVMFISSTIWRMILCHWWNQDCTILGWIRASSSRDTEFLRIIHFRYFEIFQLHQYQFNQEELSIFSCNSYHRQCCLSINLLIFIINFLYQSTFFVNLLSSSTCFDNKLLFVFFFYFSGSRQGVLALDRPEHWHSDQRVREGGDTDQLRPVHQGASRQRGRGARSGGGHAS